MAIRKSSSSGIPKGNTANRSVVFPSPQIGDVYYNGQLEILEIFNGTSFVAVSAPPATPSIVTPTDASSSNAYTSTAGQLSVVFTAGLGGGTPNQYNAYTTAGGHSASSSSSTVTLTGLTPGTAYTVYGNAQNNFGTTVNTPNAAAVTPTTLPQVPTIGTATASASVNEVTVTWTLGNNGGKALSAITITPFLNGTTAETSRTAATTSSTSYTFTQGQLTGSASYTFKVKATNANGTSADSTASNSATMPDIIAVDFLVIAGGGGGGGHNGGGGGAGGYRTSYGTSGANSSAESTLSLSRATNYTVTVGNGDGAGSAGNGGNSTFSTITSTGGGGATADDGASASGGSGGGGNDNGARGLGTAGQGRDGGVAGDGEGGGGGGGASGQGQTPHQGRSGGDGLASTITGSSVTRGGGGGGIYRSFGNNGGGGAGGGGGVGSNGVQNTGGGGGQNASGGSGVVIVRWLTSLASITVGAGLTADSTGTDGSYSYKRFTAGSGNVSFS